MFYTDAKKYVRMAMKDCAVRQMNGYWIADVPGFRGVWIDAPTAREAEKELPRVLNEWLRKKISESYFDFPWITGLQIPMRYIYVPGNYTWMQKDSHFVRFPAGEDDDLIPDDMLTYLLTQHLDISESDFQTAWEKLED